MSQVLSTWLAAAGLLLLFALGMGLTTGQVLGDTAGQLRGLTGAVLAQLPGIMVISGCVTVAVGVLPRWSVPVSWSVLLASILLGPLFGPTLNMPQWAQNLSVFTHAARAPAAEVTAGPIAVLTMISLALVAAGTVSFRRRSLVLPA